MSKRHKSAKKSHHAKTNKKSTKKGAIKNTRNLRSKNVRLSGTQKRKFKSSKLVAKTSKVVKGRIQATRKRAKTIKKITARTQKNTGKKKHQKKIVSTKEKLIKQKEQLEQKIKNLEIEEQKFKPILSNKIKPKTSKHIQLNKEGKRIKEKNVSGYRFIYELDLTEFGDDFDSKLSGVEQSDFSFLDHGINRFNRLPRGIYITLISRAGDGDFYSGQISDLDFVVRKQNVKKFSIDLMVEWEYNFLQRLKDKGKTALNKSDELHDPDNLIAISFKFIY